MVGNQHIINSILKEHEDNPIKDKIGDKEALDIIYVITDEYWKEWRRQLTNSHEPYINFPGLGRFKLMYGKSKSYLRKILRRIRNLKRKYHDSYLVDDTRANGLYNGSIKRFRDTWRQVDKIKLEVNSRLELWKQKKIKKYGDKAII
jgi:hypothetical protein